MVDFDEKTGKTVFEVQHFTRFQLRWDEDEDEEEENKEHDDPVLQIPLEIESESVNSRRRFELPESSSEVEKIEVQTLDFSRKFKFSISPQGLMYLPTASGALKGYRLYFENEQAVKGLDILMNQIRYGSQDYYASTKHLECIWYRMARIYIRDTTYANISNDAQLWTLVNVLFGSPFINISNLSSEEVPFKEGSFTDAQIQLIRKKAFFTWLKAWKTEENLDPKRRILFKLANGEISQAAAEAAKTGFFYLANLISLTPTEFTKTELEYQIDQWTRANVFQNFNRNIAEIYEILAGKFEILPDYLNWKQKVFLILQYKSLNYYGVIQGINEFERSFVNNTDMKSRFNEKYSDICYSLLNFYSNPGSNFVADMLNPFGFQNHFSLGTSWLLFYSLFTIFEVSEEYRDINNENIKSVFSKLEFLTEAFAEELVNSGKWQLAVYILKFSKNSSHILKKIVSKNIHIDDWQIDLEYITEQVPLIELAKALHEKHSFNFLSSFNAYIESENINLASDIAIHEIAPLYIIKYTGITLYDKLYTGVLEKIVEKSIEMNRIVLEEEIYIDYLKIVLKMHEKRRPANDEELCRFLVKADEVKVKILRLPRSSFNQQVAISIMQTCLNEWRLKLFETKNMIDGIVETRMLDCVDECSLEDLLRFSEMIGELYLKSEVRV